MAAPKPLSHPSILSSTTGNLMGVSNPPLNFNTATIHLNRETPDKKFLLEWLSPLEPRERQRAIGIDRVAGVGDWLLLTNQFAQWNEGGRNGAAKPILFCYGDPGVGKTYLRYGYQLLLKSAGGLTGSNGSSLVINTLCGRANVGNTAVACVYCDFHTQNEQSVAGLLGALLKQVVSALELVPTEIQREFENSKGRVGGCRLLLPDILGMLVRSLSCLPRAFICIDALDEFSAKYRLELWESLQKIVRKCPNTRLFLTGRVHIRDEVQEYFLGGAEMLPISPKERDIELYLRMRLSRDPEPDVMDEELKTDILRIVPEVISRTFLLVSLGMDAILAETTIYRRRQALHRVANGLGFQDAYNTTLDRIGQQGGSKSKLGMDALMLLSFCEQPLRLEELRHALGIELGAEDFSINNVPSVRTILGCTLGLATIDKNASTVHLLHSTLREYLSQHPTPFVTAHSMIAEICLTYLNYLSIRALPLNPDNDFETTPFLQYATCFWGAHAAREVTESVKSLSLRLLDGYENHVSAAILWQMKIRKQYSEGDVEGVSGLHCIAFWGNADIAIAMLETKRWDLNGRDSRGDTPLMWAIRYENDRVVELLLEQVDIRPDAVIRDGRTVLSFAAESGNEGAVKLLLEHRGVNPNSSDNYGQTPLSYATMMQREGVVKLLSEARTSNFESLENHNQIRTSVTAEHASHQEITHPLPPTDDVTLPIADNPAPNAPVPRWYRLSLRKIRWGRTK